MSTQTIKINNEEIFIVREVNQYFVAIKPVCKAIGVNYTTQLEKISKDEVLSKITCLMKAIGANGKRYEMRVIPLKYVFGWLFTISPKNVNPEIKKQIVKYRMECYNAFFNYSKTVKFIQYK